MDPLLGILIYLLIFGFIIFVLLMGPSSRFRNGPIGKLHYFMTVTSLEWTRIVCRRIFGSRLSWICDGIYVYFVEKKNPVLQIIYLVLTTGSVYLFFITAWDHIPGPYVSKIHRYFIPITIVFTYASFIIACYSDPGRVTDKNAVKACRMFEYDFLLFEPRQCRTCLFPKPARSKHCSLCEMCVAKFDHHCAWINNCVGLKNFRYFILFLYATMQTCFYGTYLIFCIFCGISKKMNLHSAWFNNVQTGARFKFSNYQIALILIHQERILGVLGIFTTLVGMVVLVFLCYQFYLIFSGKTANESFKWEDLEEIIMDGELWVYDDDSKPGKQRKNKKRSNDNNSNEVAKGKATAIYWIKPKDAGQQQSSQKREDAGQQQSSQKREDVGESSVSSGNVRQRQSSKKSEEIGNSVANGGSGGQENHNGTTKNEKTPQVGRQVRSISEVKNIYNKGILGNIREALFPPSL